MLAWKGRPRKSIRQYGINPDAVQRCIRTYCRERLGHAPAIAHAEVDAAALRKLGEWLSQPGAGELLTEVVRKLGA